MEVVGMVDEKKPMIRVRELDIREIHSTLIRIEQRLNDLDKYLHEKLEYLDRRITAATSRR